MTKKYPKTEKFTVLWTAERCIHAGVCVKLLPEVYHPNKRPWIQPENAEIEALKIQISKCPSKALEYEEF